MVPELRRKIKLPDASEPLNFSYALSESLLLFQSGY